MQPGTEGASAEGQADAAQPDAEQATESQGLLEGWAGAAYGAAKGLVISDEKPPPKWEARGTILGLLLDVGPRVYPSAALLVTLLVSIQANRRQFLQCAAGKAAGLMNVGEVVACHYTKAYVVAFPALATAAFLLLVGRDFLQKRLYYGLLKSGGVLSFCENVAWKDPVILGLGASFAHCIVYVILHAFAVRRMQQLGPSFFQVVPAELPPGMDPSVLAHEEASVEKVDTLGFVLATCIPIVLVLVFLWGAYDIELTLVPLSEYLHGLDDSIHALTELHPFQDAVARRMLEDGDGANNVQGRDVDEACKSIVARYSQEKRTSTLEIKRLDSIKDADPEPSIGLLQALWPAALLLLRRFGAGPARNFRAAWLAFAVFALVWLLYILGFLVHGVVLHVRRFDVEGTQGLFHLIPLVVIVLHMGIVGLAMHRIGKTLAILGTSDQEKPLP